MKIVYIEHDRWADEYVVKGKGDPERRWYFTNDRDDAIGTAKAEHGADCKIVHRRQVDA